MPRAKLNDISMYYEIHGEGDPLVLIAGFGADHTRWSDIIDDLKKDHQVILFDNRGVGQTDVPKGPYSIEDMSNDVVHLCSFLGVKQAHFVGNSMGGFILQTLARTNPDLVKSAVISHSASNIHQIFQIYLAAELELLKAKAPLPALIKASLSWVFSYSFLSKPGVLEQLIQLSLNNPSPFTLEGYEGQYAALLNFDSSAWAKDISVPTLILGSDEDLIFSNTSVKSLVNTIPRARYYQFKNCGHLPQNEQPKIFSKVVIDFISEIKK